MTTSLGFTSNLRNKLVLTRSKLDNWVEHEKARIDALTMRRIHTLESQQKRIDDKVAELLALRKEGSISTAGSDESLNSLSGTKRENQLLEDTTAVEREMEELKLKHQQQEVRIQELEEEREVQKVRAQEARRHQKQTEITKQTTIDDLTRGIVNYQYLGLDFQKARENHMRFVFTLLDPETPQRPFSFLLQVVDDSYVVDECEPVLSPLQVQTLQDELNASDDMMAFCMGMRQAFEESLASEH